MSVCLARTFSMVVAHQFPIVARSLGFRKSTVRNRTAPAKVQRKYPETLQFLPIGRVLQKA